MNRGFAKNVTQTEPQIANFFYQELKEQEYAEQDEMFFDDYTQGSVDMESYDP
jgi:hypothetical protein